MPQPPGSCPSSQGMLLLLEGLQGSPQVFPARAREESLAKALVTVAYIFRTHEELHMLLVWGSTETSDATLNLSNAARWCKALYVPGAHLPARGWGIMVPEGFRRCQQGLCNQTVQGSIAG